MPHWICPLCQASCHVPAAALGRTLKCPACRKMSPVSNGDLVDDPQSASASLGSSKTASGTLIAVAGRSMAPHSQIAIILIGPLLVLGLLACLWLICTMLAPVVAKDANLSSLDVVVLMCLGLVTWAIVVAMPALHMATETASDIYRCRKLLEIIANRKEDE